MKRLLQLILCSLFGLEASAQDFTVGAGRFFEYEPRLKNKRIGLVVNQASLVRGEHTIDVLLKQSFKIVKLFALEHGVRGKGGAGETIPDGVDEVSGLPIVSLYGKSKKPSQESLRDIDVLVFDIQDVGVRFYTYISSLGLIMEACAEGKVPVVVFDRPNPNGDYVEGPVLKKELRSFVGKYEIPLVYGLTIGELGRMIHGEKWMKTDGLDFTVIPMAGYDRMKPAVLENFPSSGLRQPNALRAYPSLALFEPTIISVGKGTPYPYAQYGIPGEKIGPHEFTPEPSEKHPMYEGQVCYGEEFHSRLLAQVPLFTTDIFVQALKSVKQRPFVTDRKFLDLLVGDAKVVDQMLDGKSYAEIRKGFAAELAKFEKRRRKYFIY